ncbi:hypothetical protein PP7435_CHR3-0226 [Komagataella phaffii CBS 7435]|uniref:RING-type domain-containing protein n=2 Tax=Komagataella phaffii TaxID=460519 RepID=C4R620_KOMPG|nr:Hypothetical protein PAS_chr3_0945 [Komagataella phaffii GS115]AOA63868.1 GQ67_04073T0 [Komagataella phaffii]CAH2449172.1 hypothetical protein BQ9382_C3-1255 [Komagataella phaffii CBS 7435]AOA68877.1 GQ68_04046T0 [Komagataella phaffii GS115]CAY71006.1 Hypothetical protein PAS_chr3_0945 [Komagataella phaffii GS115]CCA39198.1 hypothetical protein PP7435_CHR3-0226 [Komagataella phaffii CBS 7435]
MSSQANNGRRRPTLRQMVETYLENRPTSQSRSSFNDDPYSVVSMLLNQLQSSSSLDSNRLDSMVDLLNSLGDQIDTDTAKGVDDAYLDQLDRVNVKHLSPDDTCPICTNEFHNDPYPLVVRLPCNKNHYFDLDCIGPWLHLNKTCPLCRVDVTKRKEIVLPSDSEEEDDFDDMYG